jgi:hypothetical protein
MRKIITSYEFPPIPIRRFDWLAVYDDYDGAPDSCCPTGCGATEQEAIDNLIENTND